MERDLDLVFIRLPHEDVPSEITIQTVFREKILLALRDDHWLAKKKEIRCADLSGQNFILYQRRDGKSPLDGHRKAIAEKGAFRLEALQKAQGFITLIGLVAAGSGVALVPELFHYMKVPSV